MFSDISDSTHDSSRCYPVLDSKLPFADYIKQCETIIAKRRENLSKDSTEAQKVIGMNTPFERYPASSGKPKYGVLLIHGLLDCPFTCREIAAYLQTQGILSRALLLPGHGTRPSDLMHVTYQDWLQAVSYGVETLKNEVDEVYLLGFSTGSALSIYQATEDNNISGIILLSPGIKLRAPIDIGSTWHYLMNYVGKDRNWVYHVTEDDPVKYKSITFNSVRQVTRLTHAMREKCKAQTLKTRMYMILSHEDETISSQDAIQFFEAQRNPENKMLLYTVTKSSYADARIETRHAAYPDINIASISHPSLIYAKENSHYGQHGDYRLASRLDQPYIYGAYNRIQLGVFDLALKCGLTKLPRRVLTYNPDFAEMAAKIGRFITGESP